MKLTVVPRTESVRCTFCLKYYDATRSGGSSGWGFSSKMRALKDMRVRDAGT